MDYVGKKGYCPRHGPKDHLHVLKGISVKRMLVTTANDYDYIDSSYFLPYRFRKKPTAVDKARKSSPLKMNSLSSSLAHRVELNEKKRLGRKPKNIPLKKTIQTNLSAYFKGSSPSPTLAISSSPVRISKAKAAETGSRWTDDEEDQEELGDPNLIKISQVPPVAPEAIISRLLAAMKERGIKIDYLEAFILDACKYWSLKRERKGASLIRRLAMEPNATSQLMDSEQLQERLDGIRPLRWNLESLRLLMELTQRVQLLKLKNRLESRHLYHLWKYPLFFEMKRLLSRLEKQVS